MWTSFKWARAVESNRGKECEKDRFQSNDSSDFVRRGIEEISRGRLMPWRCDLHKIGLHFQRMLSEDDYFNFVVNHVVETGRHTDIETLFIVMMIFLMPSLDCFKPVQGHTRGNASRRYIVTICLSTFLFVWEFLYVCWQCVCLCVSLLLMLLLLWHVHLCVKSFHYFKGAWVTVRAVHTTATVAP